MSVGEKQIVSRQKSRQRDIILFSGTTFPGRKIEIFYTTAAPYFILNFYSLFYLFVSLFGVIHMNISATLYSAKGSNVNNYLRCLIRKNGSFSVVFIFEHVSIMLSYSHQCLMVRFCCRCRCCFTEIGFDPIGFICCRLWIFN